MSGIAGIIRFDGVPVEPGLVETMTSAMPHRGPDGISHWARGSVALGQCMLRTTPESLEENQPLANEDESLVLVMDGRVDNWEELRRELLSRGAVLRSRSDAELVLRSYETWEQGCLAHIDGDFALVIWDARRRAAFCARDRMGNKPFNYHWDGTTLTFASELHTILRLPWVKQEFNKGTLVEFLAAEWYSRDETFWKGVMRLVAAHCMEVGEAGPRTELYWEPDLSTDLPFQSDEEHIECYRELFADTVRRMSRSHRPVAYEVSGGLDSSAIFAMAETLRRRSEIPAPGINAYTLDFSGDPDADELRYSRSVGEHLGVCILEVPPTFRPVEWYRGQGARYREFPGYPNGTMSLRLREAAHASGSRALLGGDGGDQWLGQADLQSRYVEALKAGEWKLVLATLNADIRRSGVPRTAWSSVRSGVAALLPAPLKSFLRGFHSGAGRSCSWLTPELEAELQKRRRRHQPCARQSIHRHSQHTQLQSLRDPYAVLAREMEERSSAGHGLELRHPFWSAGMVQFAFSTPERLRSLASRTKQVHRRAMRGILPELVLERETKAEFSITFRTQLAESDAEIRSRLSRRRPEWVHPADVVSLLERSVGRTSAGHDQWRLWGLVGCDAVA